MADNVTAPAAGLIFATDELTGAVHWPYAKIAFGADGAAVPVADANGARLPVLIGGAVPLPTGAAAETTLAALSAKIAALESGRTPVAVQTLATTTRAYDYAGGLRLTTAGAGQVRSTAVTATEVLLHPSVRGFFRVGDVAVAATVGLGSIPLAADEKFHLRITSGQFVSFIRDGATDGSLSIVPVA